MQKDVLVKTLRIQVDIADSTYMPSVVQVNAGDSLNSLRELTTVTTAVTDKIVTLISNLKEYHR